jgi:processing peptidase subunit alpha
VSSGFEILADLLRNGKFEEWQTKDAQVWTNDLIAETAEKNKIDEAMHSTAYGFSALGQPQYPDETSYEHVPHSLVAEWNNNFLTDTSKLVVAAQNIPHNVAVNLAEKFFGDLKKTDRTVTSNPARYVGGDYRNYNGSQGSVQVGLGFATPGYTELGKDYLVYHLLQFILGSGADFSSGGPGKGIHTRLSKDIAYTNGTVMSVGAQVRPYSDSGLFYVEAQAFTNGQRITQQLIDQLNGLESIAQKDFKNDEELVRAKNRLKSHYLQSAEDEATNVSDMAYQTLLQGSRPSTAEVFAALDKLTGADVTKAVRYMFSKKPTFVAFGDLAGVHPYHEIEKRFS